MPPRVLFAALLIPAALTPLHAQLRWSVFNESTTVAAPAANASGGITVTVPAGQRVTLVTSNFTPIDFTGATSGNAVVSVSFRTSGGLSAIAGGTRAIGVGLFNDGGTPADYADDAGYFTWLNGRQTGALIELRRRNDNGGSPSLLNPTGTAVANLGTGTTTLSAGALADGTFHTLQLQLVRTATGVSLGNTSSTTAGAGVWVSGGLSQTAFTNPDVPPATTRFNEFAFMFFNTTAAPVTLELFSVFGLAPINPPAITKPPAPLVLNPGQRGVLDVATTGTRPLAYEWRKDGAVVAGATFSVLALESASVADAGSYTVVVSNAHGSATSSAATVAITADPIPAAISQQPASLLAEPQVPFTLQVGAYGSAPLTYQWRKNGVAIPGATNAFYSVFSTAIADAGDYTVVVANALATVTSTVATVTFNTPAAASVSPSFISQFIARPVTLTALVGGSPPVSIQWLKNGSPIPGATGLTLSFAAVQPADTGLYAVQVANAFGSSTSLPAQLSVPSAMRALSFAPANGAAAIHPDTPLRLTFDRAPVVGNFGAIRIHRATDRAVVDTIDLGRTTHARNIGGSPLPFNYQSVTISGNTAVIYPRGGVLTYGQTYYLTIDEGAFRDSTGASFAGFTGFTVWRFATRASGPAADATAFTVAADGSGDFLTVQGAIDAVPVPNSRRVTISVKRGTYFEQVHVASNRPLLTIRGEDRAQTIITYPNNNNLNGNVRTRGVFTNAAADFTLETLTIVNSTPQGGSQAEAFVSDGQRVLVNRVNLRSRQDTLLLATGTALVTDSYIEGNTDFIWGSAAAYFHRCELRALDTAGQEGFYTQSRNAQNQVGFVFSECRLTGEPTAARYYLGRIDPNAGNFPFSQAVWLNCAMGSHILPVGWQLNNAPASATVQNWEFQSTDLTGATLDVRARHASSRQIDASTAARYGDPAFVLGGWSPRTEPAIEVGPVGTVFVRGSHAQLTAQVTGFPAPALQWLWNGTPIPGATNTTLFLPAVSVADTGDYRVVVTGGNAPITSAPATISLKTGAHAGIYFGGFGAGTAEFNQALYVRDDGSAVHFAHSGNSGLMCRSAIIDGAGNFAYRTLGVGGLDVRGRIAPDGIVTGEIGGNTFVLRREPAEGLARSLAGYYVTGVADAPHTLSFVVSATGRAYAFLEAGNHQDGGTGLLNGTAFIGRTGGGASLSATFSPDGSTVSARAAYNLGTTLPGPFLTRGVNDRIAHLRRLAQLSSRVQVGAASPAIAGFVIRGDAPLRVLARAVGPTLGSAFGVSGALANPRLDLFRGANLIASNSGWSAANNASDAAIAATASGAFALPNGSADSALLLTLAPGAYSAVIASADGSSSGAALIELYDLSGSAAGQRLVNLSTRATVGADGAVLIAGLVVASPEPKRLLLRALGPSLARFGVTDRLARPVLSLYRAAALVVSNENWSADINTSNTVIAGDEAGLFRIAFDDADSALLVNLPAGNYTAVVTGAGGATGTALIEVYELP